MPLSLLPMQIAAAPGLWGEPKGDATSAFRSLMNVRCWRRAPSEFVRSRCLRGNAHAMPPAKGATVSGSG